MCLQPPLRVSATVTGMDTFLEDPETSAFVIDKKDWLLEDPEYPMWCIKLDDFLSIDVLEPHETCLERGQLHCISSANDMVVFISHQWMGSNHPDQTGEQFKVMQKGKKVSEIF